MAKQSSTIQPAIRAARRADFEPLLRLVAAYYEFDSIAFDQRTTGRALRRLLSDKSLGRVWVAEAGRELVGYAILTFNYDLEFGGLEGMMTDLFLASAYRRNGLGARLVAAAAQFCRGAGISAIELQVTRNNRAAQAFYRALGFETLQRVVMNLDLELGAAANQ